MEDLRQPDPKSLVFGICWILFFCLVLFVSINLVNIQVCGDKETIIGIVIGVLLLKILTFFGVLIIVRNS